MKAQCKSCSMKVKSKEACQKRQCSFAEPLPVLPPPPKLFPMEQGETISFGGNELHIAYMNSDGLFDAQIVQLADKSDDDGHNGKYIHEGKFYRFDLRNKWDDLIAWGISGDATEHFHNTGYEGSAFLLYWSKNSGFSFEIDS